MCLNLICKSSIAHSWSDYNREGGFMSSTLTDYEKLKVLRPLIGGGEYDENGFPILSKEEYKPELWGYKKATCLQNASPRFSSKNTILLMFTYDSKLESLWNNPLKKIPLFSGCYAVGTADFSLHPHMNINQIRHNIYRAKWLGKTWQNLGCTVYPTISWCLPDTYDICFSGYEKESIVIISTLGCQNNKEIFLQGFNEMKKRIEPSLIIVYGDMIEGMTGRFVNFPYKDCFQIKNEQLHIKELSQVFEIKEVETWAREGHL